ncbi:hypothetical protein HOA55_04600 [archaeon]|nr:hypothetical protein [archaeon]MBT6820609.1 hypothetical protein [archaeon]MBT7024981.1 hypothetical protein [archaeon]MBT7238600.1 hypothetical protein [archaeon]
MTIRPKSTSSGGNKTSSEKGDAEEDVAVRCGRKVCEGLEGLVLACCRSLRCNRDVQNKTYKRKDS